MKLKSIHFSGFKSFVDPTTLKLPSRVTGIVGPNGCGKSNVIDAVRWVMGESSAKTLRGDSMTDVIFNGSSSRHPVGKAMVELMFDNTAGKAPGAYAQYAEISIKRSLSRDGQSDYYLNNVRCRRKDITEIFLGTGLGPRSYSIIEQGMISRIVEARPEDLRNFVEEAAGISKYKEKRRETENRIRHTRENLERVEDIRNELETQLRRLDRQSKQAKRYKKLKHQQSQLKVQTQSLKWQQYDDKTSNFDVEIAREQKELESYVALQRRSETEIESHRQKLSLAQESLNHIQGKYYSKGAEITALEQQILHKKQARQRQETELKRIEDETTQANSRLSEDASQHERLFTDYSQLLPRVERLRSDYSALKIQLTAREQALFKWQQDWEQFQNKSHQSAKDHELLGAKIDHLKARSQELQNRRQSNEQQTQNVLSQINEIEPNQLRRQAKDQDQKCADIENKIAIISAEINTLIEDVKFIDDKIKTDNDRLIETGGRLESLKELQKAALGQNDEQFNHWLLSNDLESRPRLAVLFEVEPGWEKAVDTVLNTRTASICVDDLNQYMNCIIQMEHIDVNFVEKTTIDTNTMPVSNLEKLLSKIKSQIDLSSLLANVYTADSIGSALNARSRLTDNQFLITPDGTQIGRNWISVAKKQDVQSGIIERELLIKKFSLNKQKIHQLITEQEKQRASIRHKLSELELLRSTESRRLIQANTKRSDFHKQLGRQEEKVRELNNKKGLLEEEFSQIFSDHKQITESLALLKTTLKQTKSNVTLNEQSRQDYETKRNLLRDEFNATRKDSEHAGELLANDNIKLEKLSTALESLQETSQRTQEQLDMLLKRQIETREVVDDPNDQDADSHARHQSLLESRHRVEEQLQQIRIHVSSFDLKISEQEQCRQKNEQLAMQVRAKLESSRLQKQEVVVKQQAIKEQLSELNVDIHQVVNSVPEDATLEASGLQLLQLEKRLSRLGTVNLLAIEEYDEQAQRKDYLDQQHDDLNSALNTLEEVMRKIDRETRQRFRKTFDNLNIGFKEFFPRLFGGGSASLELTDDDLLSTGITVVAQPPGKRNSTIHLLSGGEKALTAIALLFSLFELNPSPLCILDEVDAPLDDANVERYCRTLTQMAEHTQLVFITHNKVTMEYANFLVGVTMQEPGVSRLVAVDVEKALEFAGQG